MSDERASTSDDGVDIRAFGPGGIAVRARAAEAHSVAFHLFRGSDRVEATPYVRESIHTFRVSRPGTYRCRVFVRTTRGERFALVSDRLELTAGAVTPGAPGDSAASPEQLPSDSDYDRFLPDTPVVAWPSIEAFLASPAWTPGVHVVRTPTGLHVDLYIGGDLSTIPEGRALPVIFSGAVTKRSWHFGPFFSGIGLGRSVESPFVAISDPTLNLDVTLKLGWYAGRAGDELQTALLRLLAEVQTRHGRELLLVGGSGGGFASLFNAARLPCPVSALVWNPQTDLLDHIPRVVSEYLSVALGVPRRAVATMSRAERSAALRRGDVEHNVVPDVEGGGRRRVLYLQNSGDSHVAEHAAPYLRRGRFRSLGAGRWVDDAGSLVLLADMSEGHDPPPRPVLVEALRHLLDVGTSPLAVVDRLRHQGLIPAEGLDALPGEPQRLRTFIMGSCVARDTFEFLDPRFFELRGYLARQSLISAFGAVAQPPIDPARLTSPFQRRMLEADARSALPGMLRQLAPDVDLLLWDLVDERLGILDHPDGGVSTDSVEVRSQPSEVASSGLTHVGFGTPEHLARFSAVLPAWRDLLASLGLLDRTVLVAPPWATRSTTGELTPSSFGLDAQEANRLTQPYLDRAVEVLGVEVVGRSLEAARALATHQWGLAPFHYDDRTYRDLATEIAAAASRILRPPGWDGGDPADRTRIPTAQERSPLGKEVLSVSLVQTGPLEVTATVTASDVEACAFSLHRGGERLALTPYRREVTHTFTVPRPDTYRCRVFVRKTDGQRVPVTSSPVRVR
ncbi:DUF6270 domain-containing protein [Intrasporangium sp.]|uniref:DUF6270 domain-containing protein n=1 Tax=Intrasporangium sp. TaxID=1925024 RepID=UPI002D779719|nr:DUF6270 domain-containing protein [Intrasporangium sp.]